MKTITLLALVGGLLQAQEVRIGSLGPWPICESQGSAYASVMCAWFTPGHEQYLAEIREAVGTATTRYTYSAVATVVSTGQTVTITGDIDRSRNGEGFVNDSTPVVLNFGGIVGEITVTVKSSVTISISVSTHTVTKGI